MWLWLSACIADTSSTQPTDAAPTDTPALTGDTGTPGTTPGDPTGHTGTEGTVDLCAQPPEGPFGWVSSDYVHTEEDFDFDTTGLVLSQRLANLVGIERDGTTHVVATQIGQDAAGLRTLPDGQHVAVAQPDTGALRIVDLATGGSATILGGLTFPNGIEVDSDGQVYVSEFVRRGRVRQVDPLTGDQTVLATLDYPNGMAFSPDEQTMYIVSSGGLVGFGTSTIYTLQREPDGTWGSTLGTLRTSETTLGGMTTDLCGNLYVIEYTGGRVMRLDPAGATVTEITSLPGAGFWSSLRFAPGFGGWPRTEVYATNRRELYGIEVGIPGRHVLAP